MKNAHYESVVIINATLEDEQVDNTLALVQETIKNNGGEITDIEKWGRKRLAYPIQKSKSGFYTIFRFSAPTPAIAKLERMYRLDETIIRYLTIALDKKALEFVAKRKEKKESLNDQKKTVESESNQSKNESEEKKTN